MASLLWQRQGQDWLRFDVISDGYIKPSKMAADHHKNFLTSFPIQTTVAKMDAFGHQAAQGI